MEFDVMHEIIARIKARLPICEKFHFEDDTEGLTLSEKLKIAIEYLETPNDYPKIVADVCVDYLNAIQTTTGAQIDAIIQCHNLKVGHGYFSELST